MKKRNDHSPWGWIESVETIRPGVQFVTTPSHGGYYVAPLANRHIPKELREATFNGQGVHGWYEEDCDAAIVAAMLDNVTATPELREVAREFGRRYMPTLAHLF